MRRPASHPPHPPGAAALVAVALGGALGATARYGVSEAFGFWEGGWPWATLVENASGALALGWVAVVLARRFPHAPLLRPLLTTGFLGSYTTFSTVAVEANVLASDGEAVLAGLYLAVTVGAGLLAAALGARLARSGNP